MRPADIARRARELADKREKSAATTSALHVREQLLATARNYRALAAELERKLPANIAICEGAFPIDQASRQVSPPGPTGYRGAGGQDTAISGTPNTTTRIESRWPRRQ